jgi:predicted Rossmann-fold nucleotide-binding protein
MRFLVCGGRDFDDAQAVNRALDALHVKRGITCIVEGGAPGADTHARIWAQANGVDVRTFYADWGTHGRRAGPLRNARMLEEGRPDGVVAFPGGRGTADMIRQAMTAGLKVWRPYG